MPDLVKTMKRKREDRSRFPQTAPADNAAISRPCPQVRVGLSAGLPPCPRTGEVPAKCPPAWELVLSEESFKGIPAREKKVSGL